MLMDAQTNSSLLDRPTGVIAESEARPQPTWPAVIALFLLAPLVAELLTGSTPPLAWNNAGGALLTISLCGSGALLAREIVR
jgi:hypothetical protein